MVQEIPVEGLEEPNPSSDVLYCEYVILVAKNVRKAKHSVVKMKKLIILCDAALYPPILRA